MNPSKFIADFDSASAMVRALSRYLDGKDFPALGSSNPMRLIVPIGNKLSEKVREQAYIWGGWLETVPPRKLKEYDAEATAQWVTDYYPPRRYPAAMIGSSNGAAVHLCAALGIPWLPQTLLIPVERAHAHPDEFRESLEAAREPAEWLLGANPDLQVHHMHDPNQDRLMVRKLMYFRVKQRRLGAAYERFLRENLAPGATLFLLECDLNWPTTRVADRHVFQAGALGGATRDEYLHGGPRVEEFLTREGSESRQWESPTPDGVHPEAEWGFEPALRDDVERFAEEHGYRVRRIVFEQPEDLSPLVADLYRWWYRQRGIVANRLLAESFILMEPYWALRTGAVPFWTFFAVKSAADGLEGYLQSRDAFDELQIMLFSHGVRSIGYAPLERWRSLFRHTREGGRFVGVDEQEFPRDFGVFIRYHEDLKQTPARYPLPGPLGLDQLDAFLQEHGERYSVRWS